MRHLTYILFMIVAFAASAQDYSTELAYQIDYKWGIINGTAGEAHVNMHTDGNNIYGIFTGHSIPIGGRIYSISDTLQAHIKASLECIEYINGYYRKPKEHTRCNANNPEDYKNILGQGDLSASDATMEAVTVTANMISIFHFARTLDFDSMENDQVLIIPIVEAEEKNEQIQIQYKGLHDNSRCPGYDKVYDLEVNYTVDGELSPYPITCQIDPESRNPVYFGANLKIGHVQMLLEQ